MEGVAGDVDAVRSAVESLDSTVSSVDVGVGVTNSSLVSANEKLDAANVVAGVTNTKLDSTNSKLDTANTKLDTLNASTGTVNTSVGAVNTSVGTTNTKIDSTNTKLDTTNSSIGTTNTKIDTANGHLNTISGSLATANGHLSTISSQAGTYLAGAPLRRIALGYQTDAEYFAKYGRNADVDADSAPEDIWETGGLYTGFPTGAAETITLVSDSANDTADGTGMRTVRVTGLDAAFAPQTEVVTLAGATPVTTATTWSRVHRVRGTSAGSGGVNAGTITVKHSATTANVFCSILPGFGQSQTCAYTVRAGHTALATNLHIGVSNAASTAQEASVTWMVREYGTGVWRTSHIVMATTGGVTTNDLNGGLLLPEKTDIVVRALSATANNLLITAITELYVFPN